MPAAIEIRLSGLDERQVVRNGKSLAFPDIFTMQHASVLIADQNCTMRDPRIRAAARDERAQENRETPKRKGNSGAVHASLQTQDFPRAGQVLLGLRGEFARA